MVNPDTPKYTMATFLVLSVSAMVKLLLAKHEKEVGKKHHSRSLLGASVDSLANAFVSIFIIISAIIYLNYDAQVENYIGIIISLLIIKEGVTLLRDTLEEILGKKAKPEFIKGIKDTIKEFDEVSGVYDVILHSYGRDRYVGSLHIEIPCTMDILSLDTLERKISRKIYKEYGVGLEGISIYTINTIDEEMHEMYDFIREVACRQKDVLNAHGVYVDREAKEIFFDIVVDFKVTDIKALVGRIREDLQKKYDGYRIYIKTDIDI